MPFEPTNLPDRVKQIDKHWHPQHIATLNNSHSIKIATIKGDFVWHSHPDTDELFYCVSGGPFNIELCTAAKSPEEAEQLGHDDCVTLRVGDVFCVPRAMQHRPMAEREAGIMLIEKVGTTNTGERERDERTVDVKEDGSS
ncbi:hypothetical protein B0A50_05507 [Salinomyces thailandicus]|uniref:Cupin type-1 domain-containing protein n=1 Tax=Salinomyces thailandicus TaxID=706561 RepID=A0A4U0TVV4_9PEZI|nr:hypothetical protein B0A50_05507 [Salinomyces thailandica]